MKERETNFELLRILAMCMIIGLHYLGKGNVLGDFLDAQGIVIWHGYLRLSFTAR